MTDLGNAALEFAARGWDVFPLKPGGKLPAIPSAHPHGGAGRGTCKGECGHLGHGVYDATTDPARIRHWWDHSPHANIGIACGPSDLLVVDLDRPKPDQQPPTSWALPGVVDGDDVLAVLCDQAEQPYPCDTYSVATASGGTHLYFTAPSTARLGNTSRALGWLIDTRGHGGYVVGAGSHIGGRTYALIHDSEPAPLPAWLTNRLTYATFDCPNPQATSTAFGQPAGYAGAALRGEVQAVLDARPGTRNNTLNTAALKLGQLVGAGLLPEQLAADALQRAAENTGLSPREAVATIQSGLSTGIANPRKEQHDPGIARTQRRRDPA